MALRSARAPGSLKTSAASGGRSTVPSAARMPGTEAVEQRLVGRPAGGHHLPGHRVGVDQDGAPGRPAGRRPPTCPAPMPPGQADDEHAQAARLAARRGRRAMAKRTRVVSSTSSVTNQSSAVIPVAPRRRPGPSTGRPGAAAGCRRRGTRSGACGGAGRARRGAGPALALARRAAKSALTRAPASTPPSQTSAKCRSRRSASSSMVEQVEVEGVLEVGRPVGGQEERRAVVGQHPGDLGHVALGPGEVLDQMRRADPVEAPVGQAQGPGVHPGQAQALGPKRARAPSVASAL